MENIRSIVRNIIEARFVVDDMSKKLFSDFLEELAWYQSNHYGSYNTTSLWKAFLALPQDVKDLISVKKTKPLFRGDDGASTKAVMSFTTDYHTAGFFGTFVIPFTEVDNHQGIVSTDKIYKFMIKMGLDYPIGDDEGEFLVMNVKWKQGLNDRLDDYRYRR